MAKLDKQQKDYLMTRLSNMAGSVKRGYDDKLREMQRVSEDAVQMGLASVGLAPIQDRHLSTIANYCKSTGNQQQVDKLSKERDKAMEKANAMIQSAKDTIMLGDSAEVAAILHQLESDLNQLCES
jgi:hypothetical protein